MFKEMIAGGKIRGYTRQLGDRFYFFGTGNTTREDLSELFPKFEFCFLKQVHGREVIETNPGEMPEADAHYTNVPNRALVSQSADCVPVLMSSPTQVCAVHAGWKGMALNIIAAAKAKMPGLTFAALGPHIMRESFEVGLDVAEKLLHASPDPSAKLIFPAGDSTKRLFDLKRLAELQIATPGLTLDECCFDTKTNTLFHSYRRGRQSRERQYSFVVIAPDLR
ncbi:MAG: polyphenol oxidase family protein [Bdellovibrionales bacterium]